MHFTKYARILPRNSACNCQARKFLSHRCAVELHEFNAYLSTIYASKKKEKKKNYLRISAGEYAQRSFSESVSKGR